ncbi:MAG: AraC family transcriptional regulator [Halioglobus sp.]
MEISTVPMHYVNALMPSARRHGLDGRQMLERLGIDPDLLNVEQARVPSSQYRLLTQYLADELQDENCGMLAQRSKIGTFAMMCHACISCPTLGEFLQRSAEFTALVNDCLTLELHRDGEAAGYSIRAEPGTTDEDEVIIMILLAITHRLANWAIGQTIALDSVGITRQRPGYAHEYNFLFMAPIQFESKHNALRFASRYLDAPIVQSEQELNRFLSGPAMYLMTSPDDDKSLVSKIRTMIKGDVAGLFPEFSVIASQLNLTTATLRRKLRAEGSSYQQLKDDIRRDTAIHQLGRGQLTMDQVAQSVGFSEPTSFFRAFKRWTGVTPRAYLSEKSVAKSG